MYWKNWQIEYMRQICLMISAFYMSYKKNDKFYLVILL